MNQIHPFSIWIGNAHNCRNQVLLCDTEIDAVVQLAIEEPISSLPRELQLFRIPLCDGSGNELCTLQLAIKTVSELVQSQRRLLICCSAGFLIAAWQMPPSTTILLTNLRAFVVRPRIFSSAGINSRSPALAACVLAFVQGSKPETCLKEIGEQIQTDVSPALWQDLLAAYASLSGS